MYNISVLNVESSEDDIITSYFCYKREKSLSSLSTNYSEVMG